MKWKHFFAHCVTILCILSLCLTACTNTEPLPVVTTEYHTITDAPTDSVITSSLTESEISEDTESVSSARYTLRHTVHDFTAQLPENILSTDAVTYDNIYANDSGIHIFIKNYKTKNHVIYTYHPDNPERSADSVSVPLIEGTVLRMAYRLSDGRFLTLVREGSPYVWYLLESDGTVITKTTMYMIVAAPQKFVVSETDDGSFSVLSEDNQYLCYYEYDANSNSLEFKRMYDQSNRDGSRWLDLDTAQYLGNDVYYGSSYQGTVRLDMKNGTLNEYELRIPKDRGDMTASVGLDQQTYLSDYEGLYLYDNDIPSKVLDWAECNIRKSDYRTWIVNDHTFYFLKTVTTGTQTTHELKCVTTERVPWEDPRKVIQITGFDIQTEWLTDAIFNFNQTNEQYRIDLNLINVVDRSFDDINADLAEIMLYGEHPDILLFTPSAWMPLDIYYEKDVFLDLMPLLGNGLLTCAAEGMTWNGKLYTIPTTMELQTFVCADSVTDSYLTWEKFHAVMDSVSVPDSILTTEPRVIDYIYNNGIMDFCDVGRAESYYDTDTFRDMLTYHQKMEGMIDEAVGIITKATDGSPGYTRASLPAYLKEGRIKFLNVPIAKLNDILAPRLIYGDTDFTWCGYPSREGGGARLNYSRNMFSVFADSDVLDGCIEFLSHLLSDGQQCQPTLPYLPVTESGLRALIDNSRWWYYEESIYEKYSDPNAELVEAPFYGSLSALKYIPTRAVGFSAQRMEDFGQSADDIEYDEEWMKPADVTYIPVELTEDYADAFIDFLNSCHMKANVDNTLKSIVTEEISFWQGNATTLEETTKIIDSRVWIYLNE